MAVFQAYFDESGKLDDQEFVVFAGCVASISDWQSLSDKWYGVLGSQVRYIHMKEAMRKSGEFKHVKRKDRDEILVAAIELAIQRYAFSVHLSVKTSDFKTLGLRLRDRLKNPVYCCFEGMVLHLLHSSAAIEKQSGRDYGHSFQLFCDSSEEYSCQILKLYHRLRTLDKQVRDRFQCLTFAEDEHFPPLQVADIVAYCRRRENTGELDQPVLRKLVELLDKNGSKPDLDLVYRADSNGTASVNGARLAVLVVYLAG